MTRSPLVSVLLPVRDGAPHLAASLESLAAQTFSDFEVVVVDDGSSDGSAALTDGFSRHDRRFTILRQPPRGLVAALEQARAAARGRLLARMDADDIALPGRLEAQIEALRADPSLAACGGRVELFPRSALRDGMRRYERWLNGLVTPEQAASDVFVECPIAHPTLLVRREAVEAVGGYNDRGWPEDYDLVLRLWARGFRFRNVEQIVLRWRYGPERLSRRSAVYGQEAFMRCKIHHLLATLLRDGAGALVWGAGPVGKSVARELLRCGGHVRGFVEVDARKIGRSIHGVPVVSVEAAAHLPGGVVLGAVAGEEARAQIRESVAAQGRREGIDFVAVA
jgi:glycosyltransferase involved in cell wall biosynthesis